MTTCTQPGCGGTIEDGYCNVCGAPAPGTADGSTSGSASGSAPAGVSPPSVGTVGARPVPRAAGGAGVDDASPLSSATRPGAVSSRLASAPIGSARVTTSGTRVTRRAGTTSTRLRGARLGAGLTTVPAVPVVDPQSAVMVAPEVPESRRSCPSCGAPVGRSREGRPARTEGFCAQCRAPFSFTPKLKAGDLVGGQYEVVGCLAHGGLGWIYLARDRNVSDRWVVLKGLLNSGDPDALAAAIAERQFLAQVEHPLIVEIYNFVTQDGAGYIVMEYVGGPSLKELLKDRMRANRGAYDPFPVDQAIAYIVEVLPAFQYLHDLGLIYCDFKPDNIVQVGDAIKLIDLGGVRRLDDMHSAIYGTVGYQAPEVGDVGPTVASDIYTVGRSLAVLAMEFRGNQSTYANSLPPASEVPLFQRHDSLYRLLLKACAPDPADRFQSADEMRVQLLGVLREVVAGAAPGQGAARHSTSSALFDPPVVAGDTLTWRELPTLRVDPGDSMASWLATVSVTDPLARQRALGAAPQQTVEVRLAQARAAIESGATNEAASAIAKVLAEDPWEWRAVWLQGLAQLAAGDPTAARSSFNAVYGQVPGELAPKLALGLACETSGELDVAETMYVVCARTDANYSAPAAFGLMRIRLQRQDLDGSLAALDLVAPTSRAFVEARQHRAAILVGSGRGLDSLAAAVASVDAVSIDAGERARLSVAALRAALDIVTRQGNQPSVVIGRVPAAQPALRDGLERAYRELATLTEAREERVALVDEANLVRRWTLT